MFQLLLGSVKDLFDKGAVAENAFITFKMMPSPSARADENDWESGPRRNMLSRFQ
jgi:hypothetical protein